MGSVYNYDYITYKVKTDLKQDNIKDVIILPNLKSRYEGETWNMLLKPKWLGEKISHTNWVLPQGCKLTLNKEGHVHTWIEKEENHNHMEVFHAQEEKLVIYKIY